MEREFLQHGGCDDKVGVRENMSFSGARSEHSTRHVLDYGTNLGLGNVGQSNLVAQHGSERGENRRRNMSVLQPGVVSLDVPRRVVIQLMLQKANNVPDMTIVQGRRLGQKMGRSGQNSAKGGLAKVDWEVPMWVQASMQRDNSVETRTALQVLNVALDEERRLRRRSKRRLRPSRMWQSWRKGGLWRALLVVPEDSCLGVSMLANEDWPS